MLHCLSQKKQYKHPYRGRRKKGSVIATYYDLRNGEKREVKSGDSPFHELKYTYHNQSKAVAATTFYRNKSLREKSSFSCRMSENLLIQVEEKLIQELSLRPYNSFQAAYQKCKAKHSFSISGGYTIRIDCELFDE